MQIETPQHVSKAKHPHKENGVVPHSTMYKTCTKFASRSLIAAARVRFVWLSGCGAVRLLWTPKQMANTRWKVGYRARDTCRVELWTNCCINVCMHTSARGKRTACLRLSRVNECLLIAVCLRGIAMALGITSPYTVRVHCVQCLYI